MDFRFLRGSVPHFIIITVLGCLLGASDVVQAQPVDAGFRGPAFSSGIGGDEEVTAEKPESKLWWNDGNWWGGLWSSAAGTYRIYRLDMATQQWVDTGTSLDSRQGTKMDVFWDDKPVILTDRKLYVASHHWTTSAGAGTSSQHGRLYRYSYDWAAKKYNLDTGFPADINTAKTESLTIAKDSTGQLWATWVQNQQVMVSHTLNGNDATWGAPFVLPIGSMANVTSDDLSAITAFAGDKIIVMWSRQSSGDQIYAATHLDGTPDGNWTLVAAYTTSGDDHINIKSLNDSAGQLFAVVKTANSAAGTGLIVVLVCRNTATNCTQTSDWASYPVYNSAGGTYDATRPVLLIDKTNRKLYVFSSLSYSGDRAIFYKSTDMDNIQFAPGRGELFIFEDGVDDINNPTSTKQNLDGTTDLVVLASATDNNRYYHNWINLAAPTGPEIDVAPNPHYDYGGVVVGANAFQTFAVRNLGGTNLQFNGATLLGGQASDFTITQGGAPVTVASGATHNVEVRFTPAALGLRTTTLRLASNDADENPYDVNLSGTGTTAAPDIAVTPTSHGFGTQQVGVGVTQNFTVSNTGTMSLSVGAPALLGPDAAAFAITSGQGGFPIAPGGNNTIQVRFTAPSAGPKTATLRISSNDPDENPVDIPLTGTGSVGGTTPTFEGFAQGGSTDSTSVTATNVTGVSGQLYLAAISTTHYRVVNAVTGLGLTWTRAAAQCGGRSRTAIELWWAQGAATTGSVTATLASAPDTAEIVVARYSGVAATNPVSPLVAGNTNGVNGGCSGGDDQPAYSLGVTTTVSQAVVVGAVAIRYRTHTPGSGYTEQAEVALGSGGSVAGIALVDRSVPVVSSLLLNGAFDGDVDWAVIGVELRPGASGPMPDIDVLPTPHNYGAIPVGGNTTQTFAIKNVGSANLQVNGASLVGGQSGEFAITSGGGAFTVVPGATHNLDVRFAPTSGGPKATTLRLTSDDPDESQVDVALTGSGTTPQEIDVSPTPHNYGSVSLGTSAVRTFAVRNLGGTTLQVTGVTLTGDQASDFAITQGGGSFNVLPGATHNLDVSFTPAALGGRTTTLRFTNDDADENPLNVTLSGTGVAAAPEVVATPASHDYGTQTVGVEVTQTFTISNTGTSNLVVQASTLTGPDAAAFAIMSGQPGFTIPPGGNDTIQVRFTPTSTGPKSATLSIPTNDADENPLLIPLSGTGSIGSTVPTFEEIHHGGSAGLATVTTATSLLGVPGHLYLAAVSSKSYRAVTAVTGLGLTWTRVATQCAGRNQTGIELWWARGSATTGTVTATLATAPNTALIVVSRYSGVASTDPIGLAVAGNSNGINGACSNGTDGSAYSFNVTTTRNNSVIVGGVAIRSKTHTPGSGYIERGELVEGSSNSDMVTIAISDRTVPSITSLPLNGTLSGAVDWAVIGVELRPEP
ncbi:MAG TPA: choice-of-anchor D domain-containing protein [Vicinamibacterales bacterium]